jgi:spore maturation protein CgeB
VTSILVVAPKHNYGRARDGLSYEYLNFYQAFVSMGFDTALFDFMHVLQRMGRDAMNARLTEVVRSHAPHVVFVVPYRAELRCDILRSISEDGRAQTAAWFSDDHWRFDTHTRYLAPCFNWCVTTALSALPRYAALGITRVIKSQWACNPFAYGPIDVRPRFEVTFVGQPHGTRRQSIRILQAAGVDVRTWGKGWPAGRVTHEEMLWLFSASRINLNLSNSSPSRSLIGRVLAGLWLASGADVLRPAQRQALQTALGAAERMVRPLLPRGAWDPDAAEGPDQIKGRNFEVPGCAGFLLTGDAEDLQACYESGKEIGTFSSSRNMVERVRYYLAHEEKRAAIAQAGYRRTLREHTYAHRFADIFGRMGIPTPGLAAMLSGTRPGAGCELSV